MDITETLRCAKILIDNKNFDGAKALLDSVPEESRNNEWYYLFGVLSANPNTVSQTSSKEPVTVNATLELGFKKNEKPKKVKRSRKKMSLETRAKIKKRIVFSAISLSVIFAIAFVGLAVFAVVRYSQFLQYVEQRVDDLRIELSSKEEVLNAYKNQYEDNKSKFTYVELDDKRLSLAIKGAKEYGYSCDCGVAFVKNCGVVVETKPNVYSYTQYVIMDLHNSYTNANIDKLNAQLDSLYSGSDINEKLTEDLLDYFAVYNMIKPFYVGGGELNRLLSQESLLYVVLGWDNAVEEYDAIKSSLSHWEAPNHWTFWNFVNYALFETYY